MDTTPVIPSPRYLRVKIAKGCGLRSDQMFFGVEPPGETDIQRFQSPSLLAWYLARSYLRGYVFVTYIIPWYYFTR